MLKKYEVLKENRVAKLVAVAALVMLIVVGFIVGGVLTGRNAIIADASEIPTVTSADGKKVIPAPYSPVNVTGVTIIDENGDTQNNVDLAAFDFHIFAEYFASNAHTCGNIAVDHLGETVTLGASGAPEFGSRPNHDVDVPKLSYIGETNGWSAAAISDYFVFGPANTITEKAGQVFLESTGGKWMMGNGKQLLEKSYVEDTKSEFINIADELEKAEGYQRYLVKLMDEEESYPDVRVLEFNDVYRWSPWGNNIDLSKYTEDTIILDISGSTPTFSWFGPSTQSNVTSFISGQLNITGTQGKRVIINVDMSELGDKVDFWDTNMKSDNLTNSEESALTDNNILWNFYERNGDSVNSYDGTFSVGGTWVGTVLAPEAALKCRAGLNGSIIVNELTTTAETHKSDFTGERSIDDLTDLTITKHWKDDPALRPEYITVELKQNNDVYKTVQVTGSADSNTWTYTFTDLPVRDAEGQTYQYEIHEKPVPGYKASQMGFVLYNVSDAKPKEYKLTVGKVDENNQPRSGATLVLTSDSRANLSRVKAAPGSDPDVTLTVTDSSVTWVSDDKPVILEHLPAGSYTITEKGAPAGYIIAAEEKVTLNGDKVVTIVNKKAETKFRKENENNQLLVGAVLKLESNSKTGLADVNGTIKFETQNDSAVTWKSGVVEQVIKGLPAGSYTLSETSAPAGYDAAAPIVFTVDDSGNVFVNGQKQDGATITMVDHETPKEIPTDLYKVQITKKDDKGALDGATLKMYHSNGASLKNVTCTGSTTLDDGTVVLPQGVILADNDKSITWTSTTSGMVFDNLPAGTYIIEETSAPDGYVKANPITFTLSGTANKNKDDEAVKNNIDMPVDVTNTRNSATISKLDAFSANASTQLQGAILELTHNDGKSLANVGRGNAELVNDNKTIRWTTGATALQLTGLPKGEYTLHEANPPAGYATAADVIFNVDEYGNITSNGSQLSDKVVTMLDEPNKLSIAKNYYYAGNADGTGSSNGTLPGAKLQLTGDKDLSKVVGSIEVAHPSSNVITWTSGSAENILRYLPDGSYTLSELEAPAGYDKAADITFKVSGGKITESSAANSISADSKTLTMTDNKTVYYSVNIAKTDLESNYLAGAQLEIYKVNPDTNTADYDNPVVRFESTEGVNSLRLDNGDYILKEISAPEGYYKSEEEIKFNVYNGDVTVTNGETIPAEPVTQTLTFDANGNATIDITEKVKEFGLPTKVEYSYADDPNSSTETPEGTTTVFGDWEIERTAKHPLEVGSNTIYGTMGKLTSGTTLPNPDQIMVKITEGGLNFIKITVGYGNFNGGETAIYQLDKVANVGDIITLDKVGDFNGDPGRTEYDIKYEIQTQSSSVDFDIYFPESENPVNVTSLDDGIAVTSTNEGIATVAENGEWTIAIIEDNAATNSSDKFTFATISGGTSDMERPSEITLKLNKTATNGGQIFISGDDGNMTYNFNAGSDTITATNSGGTSSHFTAGNNYTAVISFYYMEPGDSFSVTEMIINDAEGNPLPTTNVTTTPTSAPTSAPSQPSQPETSENTTLDASIVVNNNNTDVISNNVADKTFANDGSAQNAAADLTYIEGYAAGKTPNGTDKVVFNVKQTGLPSDKQVTVTLSFVETVTKTESSEQGGKVNNLSLANKPIPAEDRPECAVQLTKHDSTNAFDEDGDIDETKCVPLYTAAGFELYNAKNNKPVHVKKNYDGNYEWNGNADYTLNAQAENTINITDYVNANGLPHTIGFTFGSVNEEDGLKVSATITNTNNGKSVNLPEMDVTSTNVYWKNLDLSALEYQNGNNLNLVITQTKNKGDYKAADVNLYQTLYTNNAQLNITKLDEGEYILIETKLPTDYDYTTDVNGMAIKSQRFTLTKDTTTQVTQNNIKKTGSVTLVKYDDNGNAKGGTEFYLYQVDSSGNASIYGGESNVYTTGDGGSVVADDLPLGYLYYAVEKTPPAGAVLDSTDPMPENFTDEKGGYLINYANNEYTYGVLLSENITSTYKQNGSNENAKVEVLSIGNSGNAIYSVTEGITTFTNTSIKVAFEKTDANGALSGAKMKIVPVGVDYDLENIENIDDIEFILDGVISQDENTAIHTGVDYKYDEETNELEGIEEYITWTSGENPVMLAGLPVGTYRLIEAEAPLGYALAEDYITFEVLADGTVKVDNEVVSDSYDYTYSNTYNAGHDVDNDNDVDENDIITESVTVTALKVAMSDSKLTGTLTLTKYEDNYASLVEGAGFELYAKGADGEYNIPIKEDGSAGAVGEDAYEFFSDTDGVITVTGLPVDLYKDYRFVETTIPTGFVENAETVDISFTEDDIKTASANGDSAVVKECVAFNEKAAIVVVTKIWVDESNRDGIRPSSVLVDIYNGDTLVKSDVEITANGTGDTWTKEITDLPARDASGNTIVYTAKEKNVPTGYTASEEGLTITNTHTLETVDISVTKTWDDGTNTKVESVTVELWADGAATGETATLSAPNWTASFTGLEKNKTGAVGEAIAYTVKETAVAGYVTSAATGSIADGFTVNNTPIIVNIAKNGVNGALSGAELMLTANDGQSLANAYGTGVTYNAATATTAENLTWTSADEAVVIYALPAGSYTLTEVEAPQYYAKAADISFTVNADGTVVDVVDCTDGTVVDCTDNTVTMSDELMKGIVTLTKKDSVSGAGLEGAIFNLLEGSTVVTVSATETEGEYNYDTNGTVEDLETNAQGKIIVKNLPVDKSFSFSEETAPAGYIKSAAAIEFSFAADDVKTASANGEKTVSVEREATNTKVTGSVTLTKKEFGTTNVIPGAKFKLYNAADTNKTALTFSGENGVYTYAADGTVTGTVTELETNASGQITVNGLPVSATADTVYKIVETSAPADYIKSDAEYTVTFTDDDVNDATTAVLTAPGFDVTNAKKTSVSFKKVWEDDLTAHDGVTVRLYKRTTNGGNTTDVHDEGKSVVLNDSNSWKGEFTDLPERDAAGNVINYVVEEDGVIGYESKVEAGTDVDFVITNTPTADMTITKRWEDGNNKDGKREDVQVEIVQHVEGLDDAVYQTVTIEVEGSNEWKSEKISNLPTKTNEGKAITYSIREKNVPDGYSSVVSGAVITNTRVTSVTIEKQWDDNSNPNRPAEITVQLYADGVAVEGELVQVKASEEWKYTWNNLTKYRTTGNEVREIVYTARETAVPDNYVSTQTEANAENGFIIKNVLETSVTVTKIWEDNNNIAGKRPASVTVQLYKGEGAAKTAVGAPVTLNSSKVDGEGNWTYTWNDLPMYDNGAEIAYSVEEDLGTNEGGYTSEVEGFVITNSLAAEKVTVTISKTWSDSNNANGLRPESITVQLMADGVPVGEPVTISAADDGTWSYTWPTQLDKYAAGKNGVEIVYTAEETDVIGYTAEYNGTAITNTLKAPDVSISKVDAVGGNEITGAGITLELVEPATEGDTLANVKGSIAVEYFAENENLHDRITWRSDAAKGANKLWNMPLGQYKLTEVLVPNGYEQAEAVEFEIREEGGVRKIYSYNAETKEFDIEVTGGVVTMKDAPKKAVFSKIDAGAGTELAGALLTVEYVNPAVAGTTLDPEKIEKPEHVTITGNTIVWRSLSEPTQIGLLPAGEYTLTETEVPNGYLKAETIAFRVNADHTVEVFDETKNEYVYANNVVLMKDAPIKAVFSKVDAHAGGEIAGAELTITAGEGVTLDPTKIDKPDHVTITGNTIKWTSQTTKTEIGMLPAGEYTLKEETAPDGYLVAEEMKFRVNENHTVDIYNEETKQYEAAPANTVVMKDEPKKAVFSKVDAGAGTELEGAELIIEVVTENLKVDKVEVPDHVEIKNNTISWTSQKTPTEIGKLPAGEYTLTEITAPDGYEKAETIKFKVNPNHTISVFNVETKEFELVDDNTVVMKDAPSKAKFSKKIAGGGKELAGAKLEIKPSTKGVKIDEVEVPAGVTKDTKNNSIKWTSTATPIEIGGLPAGDYILVETQAPNGYEIAETIKFRVNANHTVSVYDATTKKYVPVDDNTVVMYDAVSPAPVKAKLTFTKRSDKGMTLSGAEFKLNGEGYSKSVTSAESGVVTFVDIPAGTFTLTEVTAPIGYTKSASVITVVVDKDGAITFKDASGKAMTITEVEKALINTEKGSGGTTTTATTTTTTRTTTTTTRNSISNVQGDGNSNNPNTGDDSAKNIQIAMTGLQISIAAMLACAILYLRRRKKSENA